MKENQKISIKEIKRTTGKYIKKTNIIKKEEKQENTPTVGCFQLVVIEKIPWYKKIVRKVFGIFKLKITISHI